MIEAFFQEIEKYVFAFKNFDLYQEVLTKEGDESFQFKNNKMIANKTFEAIFTNFDTKDFIKLIQMMKKRDGIIKLKEKKKQITDEQENTNSPIINP